MPQGTEGHALQCGLDAGAHGLWCGSMNPDNPLIRYHTYVKERNKENKGNKQKGKRKGGKKRILITSHH
jgi:hypothetical protein